MYFFIFSAWSELLLLLVAFFPADLSVMLY